MKKIEDDSRYYRMKAAKYALRAILYYSGVTFSILGAIFLLLMNVFVAIKLFLLSFLILFLFKYSNGGDIEGSNGKRNNKSSE